MSRATGCVALTGYCERQGVKYAFDLRFKGPPAPKQLPSSRRVAALLDDAKSLSVEVEEAGLLKRALARCTAWQCRVVPKVPACDSESPSACCSESPSACCSVSSSRSSVATASPLAQGQRTQCVRGSAGGLLPSLN